LTYTKQQWTIEEMSIFSNSSHLEWRAGLSDTIFKGNHTGTTPARFGLIWFSGFRGEDLNVIFYQNMPKAKQKNMCVYGHQTDPIFQPPTLTFFIGNYSTLIFASDPINFYTEFR
jgi:hypothetical protein